MEQRRAEAQNLFKRVLSALVLIPLALGAVWYGFPVFDLLVIGGFIVLLHEWIGLCAMRDRTLVVGVIYVTGGTALVLTALGSLVWGVGVLAAGFGAAFLYGAFAARGSSSSKNGLWLAAGYLYFSGAVFLLLILRRDPAAGLNLILFLFLIAWATDTGAYIFGRLIGGPKMAPVLSPNKTWAGLIGGVICAAGIGAGFSVFLDKSGIIALCVAGAVLGIVSQGGDLLESSMKRRFQVKDAGNLIPGHGGLLDRVDSLLAMAWVSGLAYWAARDKVVLWM